VKLPRLPQLSIATKLYVIFALLATVTMGVAAVNAFNAYRQGMMTREFEGAYAGAMNVERVNGLIYAVVMETRGISLAADDAEAKLRAGALRKYHDRLTEVLADWQRNVRSDDATSFREFSGRLKIFQDFRRELARRATEVSLKSAKEWISFDDGDSVHTVLGNDLARLAKVYSQRSERIYADVDRGIAAMAWWMTGIGSLALLLAAAGIYTIRRAVARPLARITQVTEAVAAGEADAVVPYEERGDEIGALARSIAVFQKAMHRNDELGRTVQDEAQARARRQEQISAELERFGADVETTLAELARICEQMLGASGRLSDAADNAAGRTAGATTASAEASDNVREIAAAAEELSASVNEIERQVAQSNAISEKAVSEAEQTNATVQELNEAASRIGEVVKLITDIAEQTNLLALNATIEAARAGDAGRGFAVVASEVKALSGQTAKATEEISSQITAMQNATMRSIEAIGAIERTIRDIGAISGAIAAAVTQQGAATQEIARSVDTAARRTIETSEQVEQVSEATTATRQNAGDVKTIAGDLGNVATRVRSQVDQFFNKLRVA
jgi:methyl-accepting chemotaxis protein